jgi:hypothetical protein
MIFLYILAMSVYGFFMWISIKFTDLFPSHDWYWIILSFVIGLILACIEFLLLLVGIGVLLFEYIATY